MAKGILRAIGDFLFGDEPRSRERVSTAIRRATRERQAEEEAFHRFMKMREQIFSEYERLSRFRRQSDLLETLSIMREIRNFSEEFANGHSRSPSLLTDIAQLASSLLLLSGKGLPHPHPITYSPKTQETKPPIQATPPATREEPEAPKSSPTVQPLTDEQAVVVGIQILLADAIASGEDPDIYVDLILHKLDTHPELRPYAFAIADIPAEKLLEELRRLRPSIPQDAVARTARFQLSLKEALSGSNSDAGDDFGEVL